jgi:cell division transport system permease protein
MDLTTALSRARRNFLDDWSLHTLAVASLVVAFLCLGVTLLAVSNLDRIAARWGNTHHLSLYLKDSTEKADISQLQLVLESLPEVTEVEYLSPTAAQKRFLEQTDDTSDFASLPTDVFPASLEITLGRGVRKARLKEITGRLEQLAPVEEVETYQGWFDQLASLLRASQWSATILAFLVAICVIAVIGNTVRMAIAHRSDEIEVLKLCGATDSFVRMPFVIEGAIQGSVAALFSIVLLLIVYAIGRGQVAYVFTTLTGVPITFFNPLIAVAVVIGGGAAGALGSVLSLRRYLCV